MNYGRLEATLLRHEGLRHKPYECQAGKLTIGIGRNIEEVGITENEALFLLKNDVQACEKQLRTFEWFEMLSDIRQEVLLNLCFNIGFHTFKKFRNMIQALSVLDFNRAADEMKDSKWYHQVGKRSIYLVDAMRNDSFMESAL